MLSVGTGHSYVISDNVHKQREPIMFRRGALKIKVTWQAGHLKVLLAAMLSLSLFFLTLTFWLSAQGASFAAPLLAGTTTQGIEVQHPLGGGCTLYFSCNSKYSISIEEGLSQLPCVTGGASMQI